MTMEEKKSLSKGLLIGVVAGASVGAITALLFAPKSGKRLREDIRIKSQNIIEDADNYISSAKQKVSRFIHDVKKKSEQLVIDAEEKVDALLDESDQLISDTKEKVSINVNAGKANIEKETNRLKSALKAGMEAYKSEKEV